VGRCVHAAGGHTERRSMRDEFCSCSITSQSVVRSLGGGPHARVTSARCLSIHVAGELGA